MDTTLEQRVTMLERSARRWRAAAVLGIGAAAAATALGIGAASQPMQLVQAKRLEIVNDNGVPVLTLAQNDAGGIIATQSQMGEILVTITATRTGEGVIAIADRNRRRLVELSGKPGDGVGVINTFDPRGHIAVSLRADIGGGIVQTFDNESPTATIPAMAINPPEPELVPEPGPR